MLILSSSFGYKLQSKFSSTPEVGGLTHPSQVPRNMAMRMDVSVPGMRYRLHLWLTKGGSGSRWVG